MSGVGLTTAKQLRRSAACTSPHQPNLSPQHVAATMAQRRPLLNGFIFLIVVVCAGCDDGVSPPDVAGRYALDTVNGEPVPYLWTDGPFTDEWLDAASITLRNDGDFLSIAEWRTTYANGNPDSRTSYPVEGTYRVRGSTITFFADGEVWASGSITDGSAFTLIGDNFVEHVYRR